MGNAVTIIRSDTGIDGRGDCCCRNKYREPAGTQTFDLSEITDSDYASSAYPSSDFLCRLVFQDAEGQEIGVPEYDFKIQYFVRGIGKVVEATKVGDVLTNCYIGDDGYMYVHFDDPQLGRGKLVRKAYLYIPDDRFDDGYRTVIRESIIGKVK